MDSLRLQGADNAASNAMAAQQQADKVQAWLAGASPGHEMALARQKLKETEKKFKRKDYAFRRQLNEMPNIIPGCPGGSCKTYHKLDFASTTLCRSMACICFTS